MRDLRYVMPMIIYFLMKILCNSEDRKNAVANDMRILQAVLAHPLGDDTIYFRTNNVCSLKLTRYEHDYSADNDENATTALLFPSPCFG